MGGRVSQFRVGRDGGHIVTDRNNFWIALAPYFFPLYSIIAIAIYGALSLFMDVQPFGRLLYAVIGVTWAFHFTFTCWMISKRQTDLTDHGTFFSLVLIYLMNLLLLSVMLVVASAADHLPGFRRGIVESARTFAPGSFVLAAGVGSSDGRFQTADYIGRHLKSPLLAENRERQHCESVRQTKGAISRRERSRPVNKSVAAFARSAGGNSTAVSCQRSPVAGNPTRDVSRGASDRRSTGPRAHARTPRTSPRESRSS